MGFEKVRKKLLEKDKEISLLCNWEYQVTPLEKKLFCRTFDEKIHPLDRTLDRYEKQRLTKKIKELFQDGDTFFDWRRKESEKQKKYFEVSKMNLKESQFFCLYCNQKMNRKNPETSQTFKEAYKKTFQQKTNFQFITL